MIASLVLSCFALTVHAETITVCASGCDYTSIQSAIDASSDYDIIKLEAGYYYLSATLNLNGKAITIQGDTDGDGNSLTILNGSSLRRIMTCVGVGDQDGEATIIEDLIFEDGQAEYPQGGAGLKMQP